MIQNIAATFFALLQNINVLGYLLKYYQNTYFSIWYMYMDTTFKIGSKSLSRTSQISESSFCCSPFLRVKIPHSDGIPVKENIHV